MPIQLVSEIEQTFKGLSSDEKDTCTIEGSVITGFELAAKDEIAEKLRCWATTARGRVIFDVPIDKLPGVLKLRSIDNCYILIGLNHQFDYGTSSEESIKNIEKYMNDLIWEKGLSIWKNITQFSGSIEQNPCKKSETKEGDEIPKQKKIKTNDENEINHTETLKTETVDNDENSAYNSFNFWSYLKDETIEDSKESKSIANGHAHNDKVSEDKDKLNADDEKNSSDNFPTFRVTCYRTGEGKNKHKFQSGEAAAAFGGAVMDHFNWKVKMKQYDLEIVLNVVNKMCYVGLTLTKESLHNRNIVDFGPTTLRPTICYGLLHLASIQPSDRVIDPMCGGASIPIEGALAFPEAYYMCGDNHEKAIARTVSNLSHHENKLPIDAFQWDATCLPLKDGCIDVVITDLPFGKRMGSQFNNRTLYPQFLEEMARICRPKWGRAVILTQDKNNFFKTVQRFGKLWKNPRTLHINIGGLAGSVFVLQRTALCKN